VGGLVGLDRNPASAVSTRKRMASASESEPRSTGVMSFENEEPGALAA
jgi:hypothetical protein